MNRFSKTLFVISFLTAKTILAQIQVDSIDIATIFYGPFNKTTVELYLYNPTESDNIEGSIEFEINKTAFIENLYLEINGELKKANTLSKYHGERIYDLITHKRIDPALLTKTGEGKYSLKVFPFFKHQMRKVVFEYYSVLESDSTGLQTWWFDLDIPLKNYKSQLHLTAYQEENIKLFRYSQQGLIGLIKKIKTTQMKVRYCETLKNEKQFRICFDFSKLNFSPVYYLDSLQFYQTKDFPEYPKLYPICKDYFVASPLNSYPVDFITELLNKINTKVKPKVFAAGQDEYLNGFLKYLEDQEQIYLELNSSYAHKLEEIVEDDYNWIMDNNHWYYFDEFLTLTQKVSRKKKNVIYIKCPFLNKFPEYLFSLRKDLDHQINVGFLNSKLSKIVIEEEERAVQIWKNVTGEEFGSEPTYFVAVEEMPEPIGGIQAIQNSVFFPANLLKGIQGFKVYMLAFISKTGHVMNVKTIKGPNISHTINALAEKISQFAVYKPTWKPGKQRGRPVAVQVSIPIVFKTDSLSETKEINFSNRKFITGVRDNNICLLIEKDFQKSISETIEFKSIRFFQLMIKNPDLIEATYKAMYLSNFDGIGFKSVYKDKTEYYFIKQSL